MQKRNLTLLTDLYELTMMNGYYLNGKQDEIAVFDVFFRQNELITYSLAAGLEQAVDYCLNLNFGEGEIAYLKSLGIFDDGFLQYLKTLKFTGDIYAVADVLGHKDVNTTRKHYAAITEDVRKSVADKVKLRNDTNEPNKDK